MLSRHAKALSRHSSRNRDSSASELGTNVHGPRRAIHCPKAEGYRAKARSIRFPSRTIRTDDTSQWKRFLQVERTRIAECKLLKTTRPERCVEVQAPVSLPNQIAWGCVSLVDTRRHEN